jgi:hypothetical protein
MFPDRPEEAIRHAFTEIESEFLLIADNPLKKEVSGSCALVCLVIGNTLD